MDTNYPVVMYEVDTQTVVAIFKGTTFASKYLFNKVGPITTKSILKKRKYDKPYDTTVTFRSANKEYSARLGNNDYLIFNDKFKLRNGIERKRVSFDDSKPQAPKRETEKIRERNKKVIEFAKLGYVPSEISEELDISYVYANKIARESEITMLPEIIKGYDIPELIKLLKVRQKLLSKQSKLIIN